MSLSEGQVCSIIGADRKMIRYHSNRSADAALRGRLRDLDLWAYQRGVMLDFSRPGKPTDNAFIEAFNFRPECLNTHWLLSLAEAQEKVET